MKSDKVSRKQEHGETNIRRIKRYLSQVVMFSAIGRLHKFSKSSNDESLRVLKDIHKGERCFIVATGPSLRVSDVEKLKDEYTFSVNSIFMLFDKTAWRSNYYVCLDERHFENMLSKYPEEMNSVCTDIKFFNANCHATVDDKKLKIDNALYVRVSGANPLTSAKEKFYFSKDLVKGVHNSGTVTNVAINIAMYMGFKKIYLLGVDCNYQGKLKHFSSDWNDQTMQLDERDLIELRMRNGFREMSGVAKQYEVEIYNATRGGMLEVFPRVDLDKVLEET